MHQVMVGIIVGAEAEVGADTSIQTQIAAYKMAEKEERMGATKKENEALGL